MTEGVGWAQAPVIALLWLAAFACLVGIEELRWPESWVRRASGPPSAREAAGAVAVMAFFALSFVVVLFAVYHWFGVLFVLVPVMAAPMVFLVLHFRNPWEGALTYRIARNCLIVLVLSLVAAVAYLETVGL